MAHLYNHTKTQQKLQQARKLQLSQPKHKDTIITWHKPPTLGVYTHTHTESDLTGVKRLSLVRRLLSKVNLLSISSCILYRGIPHLFIALKFNVKKGTFFCSLLNRVSSDSLQLYQIHRKAVGGVSNAAPTVEENKSLTVLEQSMSLQVLFKCGSATGEHGYLYFFKDLQSRILSNIDCLHVKVLT